jgi:hypothetical protein
VRARMRHVALLCLLTLACRARPHPAPPRPDVAPVRDVAPPPRPVVPYTAAARATACDDALFVDDPNLDWVELSVTPTCPSPARYCGADGIARAFRDARDRHPDRPVRIWLESAATPFAPRAGFDPYADPPRRTNLSLVGARRTARTPISLRARDPRPGHTVVNHTLYLVACAFVAIEGITVGAGTDPDGRPYNEAFPLAIDDGVHVIGVARDPTTCGLSHACGETPSGAPKPGVYGRFDPSHHIILRHLTLTHLRAVTHRPTTAAAALFESIEPVELGAVSGIKVQHAEDVWVLDNRVDDVSRHGIDNVGVHRGVFCGNTLSRTSADGYAIEAKGASSGIVYEANDITGTHGLALGGPCTDFVSVFPPSTDYAWDFEAEVTVARRNRLRDPRRAALEFVGCRACSAVDNTVTYAPSFRNHDGTRWRADNGVRLLPSRFLATADGAGDACTFLHGEGPAVDFDLAPRCWGVGSHVASFVSAAGRSTRRAPTTAPVLRGNTFTARSE